MWGLKRKLCDVDFISYVQSFDILLLGETWISKDDPSDLDIKGFECSHVFAQKSLGVKCGRSSGGVSVYYKTCLKPYINVVEKSDFGIIWIKIKNSILPFNEDAFFCYVYVRDPKSQVLRHEEFDYFEILEQQIAKYKTLGKVFITGDMNSRTGQYTDSTDFLIFDRYLNAGLNNNENFDIPSRSNKDTVIDNNGRRLLDMCKSTGLLIGNGRLCADQDIGEFTCITPRGRSVVDYFLLSYSDFDCISEFCVCDPDEYSDHCALYICLNLKSIETISSTEETCFVRKLLWSCKNEELFKNSLLQQLNQYEDLIFSAENDNSLISEAVENFSKLLFDNAFQFFGKSSKSESKGPYLNLKQNPWFDNCCKTAKQNFNRAKHEYSRNRTDANRVNLTRCRSKLNKTKRRAKAIFKFEEGKRVENLAKSNPKSFWKEIKKFTKKKSKSSDTVTAEDFFEHFSGVFGAQSDDDPLSNTYPDMQANIQDESLDTPFSMDELKKVISSLKSNKSPGIDGLIAEIFKSSYDILSPILLRLFNVVFSSGCYPTQWSEGLITPIHKKASLDEVNNYRGITLINIMSKIYSHLLNNRLLKWAENNEKLSECQFGFQKNKSTVDCIFIFHALISKVLSNGEKLYCCFIDYQKAFDLVNRGLLWHKLIRDGCSKTMVLALKAMYNSVKACVRYKNKCSSFFEINAGVKQGDPLSPVLFILFINDILETLSNENDVTLAIDDFNLFMLLYADDAVLFSKSPETLQNMLNRLQAYSSVWGLKVNTDKTKILIFEKGRKTSIDFFYDDTLLEVVDNFNI